jgi:hypothetical protein
MSVNLNDLNPGDKVTHTLWYRDYDGGWELDDVAEYEVLFVITDGPARHVRLVDTVNADVEFVKDTLTDTSNATNTLSATWRKVAA